MAIRLIAIDLDGTLLNTTKQISNATRDVLRRAHEQASAEIVLASARPPRTVQPFYELLDLQTNMHKTIIFITHDLDEALKLGDRIAIMKDGRIVQIGTPEQILTNPADDYVRAFVQNVDNTRVITASAIARKCATINLSKDGPHVAVRVMEKSGKSSVYALNDQRELQGLVKIDDALALEKQKKDSVESKLIKDVFVTDENTAIGDLLSTALEAKYPIVVQNARGKMTGIIDRATLLAEIMEMRGEIEGGPVLLSDQD